MKRQHVLEALASVVAEYVTNGFPLEHLVGEEAGKPSPHGLADLQHLLKAVGLVTCDRAANFIGVTRLKNATKKENSHD